MFQVTREGTGQHVSDSSVGIGTRGFGFARNGRAVARSNPSLDRPVDCLLSPSSTFIGQFWYCHRFTRFHIALYGQVSVKEETNVLLWLLMYRNLQMVIDLLLYII